MVDTSITGRFIDSFRTIAQQELKKAGFDKTIQAQILSCEDPVIGKYRCRYQDANIIAYSSSSEISYTKGTYVSIMVPNGDMKKDKIILSASDKFSVSYKNQTGSQYQKYNIIGNNCITSNDKFYLLTDNTNYKYTIYKYNNTNPNDIQIDTYALEQYLKQSGSFIAAATIKTSIPVQQQSRGHYGITFNLCFKENGSDQEVIRSYTIDEDSMEGNPYRLIYDTRQYSIFKIDGANFKRVDSIEIFNSGFPGANQNVPTGKLTSGNIEISLLEILGADRMTENQINGTAISFVTPQGVFFNDHSQSGDYRTIIAQIKIKGKILTEDENIPFYWGREGTDVNSNSPYYNRYLGRGWKCLNESNLIAQGTNSADRVVQWVPSTNTYIVNLNEATARDNKFKVAVVYDNRVLTKQINIQNLAVGSSVITIQSSEGNQFYYDIGHPTLTCKVNGNQQPSYIYHWAYISNMGSFQYLPQQSSQLITEGQRVIGNKIYDVKISRITDYGTFKCTVYNQNIYLGTATITLLNSLIGGEEDFSLIINHGSATYQYNENGVAPNSKGLLEPQQQNIEDLSFTLYDNEGIVVQDASEARIRWAFPINDTMLVDLNYDENLPPDEDENYRYYNTQTISYDILPQYNINKQRNQIILIINYKGIVLTAQTSFTFIKQGQPGTNGTEYLVKLVPNTLTNYVPLWPVVTKTPTKYIVNYGIGTDSSQTEWDITEPEQFFKAQLWKNGQKIWEGVQGSNIQGEPSEVTWSILKNTYGSNSTDISNFEIDSIVPGGIRYISANEILGTNNPIKPRANIVQCAIKIQNKIYYGTIPILTAWVSSEDYRVDLKDYSGFRYVLYTSDGVSPQYDAANPFEFMCQEKNSSNQWEDVNGLTYSVTPLGNYLKPSDSSQESAAYLLKIVDSIDNKYKVQPNFTYDGLCVNTSLYCQYYDQNDTKIAELCVPIHFLLNKYGLSNLNDWNGNSIQIDTDGGFILSPQIGAGHKQDNYGFTGVLMGDVKMPGKDNTDVGLMGFGNGIRTFFLNSDNGSAILGAGTGQIIIDPSAQKSMIYSHNFWNNYNQNGLPSNYTIGNEWKDPITNKGRGLLIDLSTPEIRFGSGNFKVNSEGYMIAEGGGQIAKWSIGEDKLVGTSYSIVPNSNDQVTNRTYLYSGRKDGQISCERDQNPQAVNTWHITPNNFSSFCLQYSTKPVHQHAGIFSNTYWVQAGVWIVYFSGYVTIKYTYETSSSEQNTITKRIRVYDNGNAGTPIYQLIKMKDPYQTIQSIDIQIIYEAPYTISTAEGVIITQCGLQSYSYSGAWRAPLYFYLDLVTSYYLDNFSAISIKREYINNSIEETFRLDQGGYLYAKKGIYTNGNVSADSGFDINGEKVPTMTYTSNQTPDPDFYSPLTTITLSGATGKVQAFKIGNMLLIKFNLGYVTISQTYTWTNICNIDIKELGITNGVASAHDFAYISGGGPAYSTPDPAAAVKTDGCLANETILTVKVQVNKIVTTDTTDPNNPQIRYLRGILVTTVK